MINLQLRPVARLGAAGVVDAAQEQCVAGRVGAFGEEDAQAPGNAALFGQAAEVRGERNPS